MIPADLLVIMTILAVTLFAFLILAEPQPSREVSHLLGDFSEKTSRTPFLKFKGLRFPRIKLGRNQGESQQVSTSLIPALEEDNQIPSHSEAEAVVENADELIEATVVEEPLPLTDVAEEIQQANPEDEEDTEVDKEAEITAEETSIAEDEIEEEEVLEMPAEVEEETKEEDEPEQEEEVSSISNEEETPKEDENTSIYEQAENGEKEENIVFRMRDGRILTRDFLQAKNKSKVYEKLGAEEVPAQAFSLHQKAREAGSKGEYEQALECLEEARSLAPDWPYPIYDAAYTYLLMGDSRNALEKYEAVNEMAPQGFYLTKTALDTLRKERSGMLPEGIYLSYLQIEWEEDPSEKLGLARTLSEKYPTFAPAWKELAIFYQDPKDRLEAIEKGLECNPDPDTLGNLLINKALIINQQGDTMEAIEILGKIIFDKESTLGSLELARLALSSLVDES